MTFDKGDTVNVKSGGPALTVLEIDGEHVKCLYFSEELGEFRETTIPAFALEAFDEPEEGGEEEDELETSEAEDDDEDQPAGGKRRKAA